jgi:dTDP-4-amino-4,6-dideoxygalactose transaminase
MSDVSDRYRAALSSSLDDQPVHLYWKARVGLYALLKALNIQPGDEVILPAYTCVVVPNAILYLGAVPVYVDIDLSSFNARYESINSAVSSKTKAVICQNTYGLSVDLNSICEMAAKRKLTTIEDCTHGFGGTYNGRPNGLTCDSAIFSTQWNKPFSTGIGGFSTARSNDLNEAIRAVNNELQPPAAIESLQLTALILARKYLMRDWSYWQLLKLYRWLSSKGLVVGSSSPAELEGITISDDYFKAHSNTQSAQGLKALREIEEKISVRRNNAMQYTNYLATQGKNHVKTTYHNNHSFLTYPILVKDRFAFQQAAERCKIQLGDWFTSPLHPIAGNLDRWKFQIDNYPVAKFASEHVVNLPTTPNSTESVLQFLSEHQTLVFDVDS